MEAAIDKIRELAGQGEAGRRQLMDALHKLAYSLETVNDTIHRYGHMAGSDLSPSKGFTYLGW